MKSAVILFVADSREIRDLYSEYIDGLRDAGCRVYTMTDAGGDFEIGSARGIRGVMAAAREIFCVLRGMRFDAVVVSGFNLSVAVRLAAAFGARGAVVNLVNGYPFLGRGKKMMKRLFLMMERLLRRKTQAVVAVTDEDFAAAQRYELYTDKIYKTRGFGVRSRGDGAYAENLRSEYSDRDSFVICTAGELEDGENVDLLIRAMPSLCGEIPGVSMWIVGDGSKKKTLSELARELGVRDKIIFLSDREDVCDFVSGADIFACASGNEKYFYFAVRAMNCGKTALLANTKTNEKLPKDFDKAVLFEYENIEDFVNKTCQIHDKTQDFGEKSAKPKKEKHLRENLFFDMMRVLLDACGAGGFSELKDGKYGTLYGGRKKF